MAIVRMTQKATEELATIPRSIRARMIAIMAQLEQWARYKWSQAIAGKLGGPLPQTYWRLPDTV